MAEPSDSPIPGPKLQGLKYLDKLLPLFDRLHDVGCQRDKAGNRKLHFDHYCALILLFLLNPVLRSFRALQQASLLEQVRAKSVVRGPHWGRCPKPLRSSIPSGSKRSSPNCGRRCPLRAAWASIMSTRC